MKQKSRLELAEKIVEMTNSNSKIQYGPQRPGDVKHSRADIKKLLDIGFNPTGNFDDSLRKTIEFFIERSSGKQKR